MQSKKKTEKLPGPTVESPTWGHLNQMAVAVMEKLGGSQGASKELSWESFYCLSILASLNLDEHKRKAFIFGKQYLS